MKRIKISLPDDRRQAIQARSIEAGQAEAEVIRQLIRAGLAAEGQGDAQVAEAVAGLADELGHLRAELARERAEAERLARASLRLMAGCFWFSRTCFPRDRFPGAEKYEQDLAEIIRKAVEISGGEK